VSEISPQATEEVFAQEGGGFLACLTISHDDLAEPIRIVDNTENVQQSAPISYTMDRNSSKWAVNLAGTWSQFLTDVAAVTDQGINLETGKVNGVYNNGLSGAVAGSPGTLPTNWVPWNGNNVNLQSVALNTVSGLPCIDIEIGGTPSAAAQNPIIGRSGVNAWPVTPGQTIVGSAFLALIGGALVGALNILRVAYYTAAGAYLTQHDTLINTVNSTLTRYDSGPRVVPATAAFANVQLRLGMTIGVPYNVKIRIGAPQIELDALSSPIIGTGTTQTRVADALTLPLGAAPHDLVVTFDDASTQTFAGVSGDYPVDPALLNRRTVRKFEHGVKLWDFINDEFVDEAGGNLFIAFPFTVKLPEDAADSVPKAQLTIDNVSREIAQLIRSITTPPTVTIEIVRISNTDEIEVTLPDFQLRNTEWDALTVTGDLMIDDIAQEQVPQRKFTPSEYPGLF